LSRLKLCLCLLLVSAFATQASAVSYVVPSDRFEIERSGAIVVGRVLSSHVEETRFGIETITSLALEEVIQGTPGSVIEIHEPGGIAGDRVRIVPGVPSFNDGDRLLLLLVQREDGSYTVLDLQLGAFRFSRDDDGRELLLRDSTEITGWGIHGEPHREPIRLAREFLEFTRSVSRDEIASALYFASPVQSASVLDRPSSDATYTAASYTLQYASGLGTRWSNFPSSVKWNQGNVETGALGNGTAQITAAFSAWNAGGTNYVLNSANANTKGFLDSADGVNNFVFEKNLTSAGVQPFSCTSGGALGMGGMVSANFGAGAHVFHGETFGTTLEADVSMNQGLANCTTSQVTPDQFKSVIVHELGHTLGFRHSDQNRKLTAACSTDPELQCSNGAIMNHILVSGLNGKLQAWDNAAVSAVYGSGPACVAPSITTHPANVSIANGNNASLSVVAIGTAPLSYQWFAGASGDMSSPVSLGTNATISVRPSITTSYWVRVTGQCAPVANSNAAVVTVTECPAVVAGTPHAEPVSDGFRLSINGSGGSSLTYRWYQGATSGDGTFIGTGSSLVVTPSVTTSYWCRISNSCGNSVESSVVRVTIGACTAPQITAALNNQTAVAGSTVSLAIAFTGEGATVQWFEGLAGNTSHPIGTGPLITSPVLTQTTHIWARVTNGCGSVDSNVATITVTQESTRRRSARH
jgi:hypothetical protein